MSSQTSFIQVGSTSNRRYVRLVQNNSGAAPGEAITGLLFNSAGLTAYYILGPSGTPQSITLATNTVGGAYSSGGFVEVDGTNLPGLYQFDVPDAVSLPFGQQGAIEFQGAANLDSHTVNIEPVVLPEDQTISNSGTLVSATATTAVIGANDWTVDDQCVGQIFVTKAGTGEEIARYITGFVQATNTITVSPAFDVTPDNTTDYIILLAPPAPSSNPPDVNVVTMDAAIQNSIANKVLNAGHLFKQNTATNFFIYMTDSSGNPVAGLVDGVSLFAERSIDATDSFSSYAGSMTAVGNGVYRVNAAASDLNGINITWRFTGTGARDLTQYVRTFTDAN